MRTIKLPVFGLVAALAAITAPASAHHSFAMFDAEKTLTLSGTVKEFEWTNPHAWIYLTVADATGQSMDYSFEMGSPGQLGQRGMKADSLRPGDKVTIRAHPMKDGSRGGQYMSVTTADGRSFGNQGGAAAAANPAP